MLHTYVNLAQYKDVFIYPTLSIEFTFHSDSNIILLFVCYVL
jgi:hypothetical protein